MTRYDSGPEKGHGRTEQRVVRATDYLDWFEPAERKHWLGLRCLVDITRTCGFRRETSSEKCNDLTSHAPEADKIGDMIRAQW
ncbi:MAG: hypothetical protein ABJQ29_03125 [Luteolibacter sp.]